MDLETQVRADTAFSERYTLGAKLGQGGMGTVYQAVQRTLKRPVAVKFMNPALSVEQSYRERFFAEAQLAAGLIHSHVTAVFDFGVAAGVHYLVTELVAGKPLEFLIAEAGGVDPRTSLAICCQVLVGLEGIHSLGIIHRDLKPANILVAHPGAPHAKILDFGIAKQLSGENGPKTAFGVVLGSPAFMSPEQAAGEVLGPTSDLYSMSLILYLLIIGKIPFQGSTPAEMFFRKRMEDPVLPTNLLGPVSAVIRRGLARKPKDRFPDARSYRQALEAAAIEVNHVGSFFIGGGAAQFESAPATGAGLAGLRPGSAPDTAAKPLVFPTIAAPVLFPSASARAPESTTAPHAHVGTASQAPLEDDDGGRTVLLVAVVVLVVAATLMVPQIHDRVFPRRDPTPVASVTPAP